MNILLILLGCNIYEILLNRLETASEFIEKKISLNILTNATIHINSDNNGGEFFKTKSFDLSIPKITWFLSGGIKNIDGEENPNAKSEASIMKSQIDKIINSKYNQNLKSNLNKKSWNYILDEKSTNTAENFIWASQFLNTTTEIYDYVYVITSAFHYERAKLMLSLIDSSRNFEWVLGDLEDNDSRYWESIHINNVNDDVEKAKKKLKSIRANHQMV
jgi:hypothetical protein